MISLNVTIIAAALSSASSMDCLSSFAGVDLRLTRSLMYLCGMNASYFPNQLFVDYDYDVFNVAKILWVLAGDYLASLLLYA